MNKLKNINFKRVLPLILSAISALVSMLTTFFVAKPLGSERYGQVQFYIGIIQIVSIISSLGLSDFFTKNTQFMDDKKGNFTKYFLLMTIWNIIISPVFFVISFFLLKSFQKNTLIIIIVFLCSLATAICNVIAGFLLGNYKQSKSILVGNLMPKLLLLIFSIFIIFLFSQYDNFHFYYICGYSIIYGCCSIPFLIFNFKKTKFKFTKQEIFSLLSFFALNATYCLNTGLAKVIGSEVYNNFSGVGAYSLSLQIVSIGELFGSVINSMSKPYFSSLSNNKEKLVNYFKKIIRINSFIIIPFCLGLIIQSKSILSFFGESYTPYFLILILLSATSLINTITGPNGSMLAMAGHEKLEAINGICNVSIFVGSAFGFVFLESDGLALAYLLTGVIINIIKIVEVIKIYKINPYNLKLIIHLICIAIVSVGVFFGLDFVPNIYIKLVLDCIIGLVLVICFFIINPNKEDKYFFSKNYMKE